MTSDRFVFTAAPSRSGVAVWRQIADTLGCEIRDRRYAQTGKLPSEGELATRFGVHRHTLRQAVKALQSEGLLRVEQGRGMFVQEQLVAYPLSRRTRFSETLVRQGLLPGKQVLTAREVPASDRVASELGLAPDDPVLELEVLHEAEDQPLNLAHAFYPAARFPGLLQMVTEGISTTEMLARLGVKDYVRARSHVTAVMPSETVARLLGQPPTRPVLCVESVDVDMDRRPIKFGQTLFSGDRVQLVVVPDQAP